MLWYPVGFAAGYLALLLFVAAPLRRSGAFTLPDFCEVRLGSRRLRTLATVFVIFIGWLYLVPQLQGAGLTLPTLTGSPYPLGALLVAGGGHRERGARRHAGDHLRAGVPVLAEAHRARRTRDLPGVAVAGRRPPGGDPALMGRRSGPRPPSWSSTAATLTLPDGDIREVRPGDRLEFAAGDPVPEVSGAATGPAEWLLPDHGGGERQRSCSPRTR